MLHFSKIFPVHNSVFKDFSRTLFMIKFSKIFSSIHLFLFHIMWGINESLSFPYITFCCFIFKGLSVMQKSFKTSFVLTQAAKCKIRIDL